MRGPYHAGAARAVRGIGRVYFLVGTVTVAILLLFLFLNVHPLLGSGSSRSGAPPVRLDVDPTELKPGALQTALLGSEEQFRMNLVKRWKGKQHLLNSAASLSEQELQVTFLVPLYPCSLEGRFGFWGEGGKWICLTHYGASKQAPVVISVGSNGDTSFERSVRRRLKAFSHTFDFSLSPVQQKKMLTFTRFLKFYNVGVSGSADIKKYAKQFPGATFVTVPQMLAMAGTEYVDIFKIDCEGCEHEVVRDMLRHYTKESVPFGQIQMEIHNIANTAIQMGLLLSLEILGYRMFHSEINGWWTQGYELAFIHERIVTPAALRKEPSK